MRIILLFILTLGVIAPGLAFGLDFEITDVIEVGPIYSGGMLRPAQWSPDGQWIAYFDGYDLMVADSLGASRAVATIEMVPRRFCWSGNEEVVVYQKLFISANETHHRLTKVDIVTGLQTDLEEFTRRILPRGAGDQRQFAGPYLSVNGKAYYTVKDRGNRSIQMVRGRNGEMPSLSDDFILRTGTDALYLVRPDFQDSLKISSRPHEAYMGLPMSLSPDRSHIIFTDTIVRLADDFTIALDTLPVVRNRPEGTYGCGFCSESFNPAYDEVAFLLTCDDGDSYVVNRVGVYDYRANELKIIDEMVGLSDCSYPAYSSDGLTMSLLSHGKLYILKREVKRDDTDSK